MVTKKKTLTHNKHSNSKGSTKSSSQQKSEDITAEKHLHSRFKSGVDNDLFVCVTDVLNKRKSLLNSLKISLLTQEECEVVHSLRSEKYEHIDKLKKEIEHINNLYIKLNKLFPNTKNIVSYAEKELDELDNQINLINQSRLIEERELDELETAYSEVGEIDDSLDEREEFIRESLKNNSNVYKEEEKKDNYNKNSKLGRIQNNLKIIEQKLKHLD